MLGYPKTKSNVYYSKKKIGIVEMKGAKGCENEILSGRLSHQPSI